MKFEKSEDGTALTLTLDKKLSAVTAEQLEKELSHELSGVKDFVVDMARLEYVSSAGLRVLLKAQEAMNLQGKMTVMNANQQVMNIFETTGFNEILRIEGK